MAEEKTERQPLQHLGLKMKGAADCIQSAARRVSPQEPGAERQLVVSSGFGGVGRLGGLGRFPASPRDGCLLLFRFVGRLGGTRGSRPAWRLRQVCLRFSAATLPSSLRACRPAWRLSLGRLALWRLSATSPRRLPSSLPACRRLTVSPVCRPVSSAAGHLLFRLGGRLACRRRP